MNKLIRLFATLTSCACISSSSNAQSLHGFTSIGAFINSDYEGSDDYEVNPAIVARLQYKNYYIQTVGLGAILNLSSHPSFEYGPAINYRMGRDDDVDSNAVSLMTEIDGAIEAGAFLKAHLARNVFLSSDQLSFEVKALFDVSSTHDGMELTFGPSYDIKFSDKLLLSNSLRVTYNNDDYMQTYFGITTQDSLQSGLASFEAGSGIKSLGVSSLLHYQLKRDWSLMAMVSYEKLFSDAKDSPLTELEGSDNQFKALLGINYHF